MTRLAQFFVSSSAVLALVSGALAAEFAPLGFFPGGSSFSKGRSVSPDGTVVVGESGGPSGIEAFRWSALDGLVALGDLPGGQFYSTASAVSADGNVIAGVSRSALSVGFDEAFRWTPGGGMVSLGDLPGGQYFSQANAISDDGSVVVGQAWGASGPEAFRWTVGGGLVGLGDLAGGVFTSRSHGVSADGSVVAGAGQAATGEAFRWTSAGGMVGLGTLPGAFNPSSFAWAVSADGNVVVGEAPGPSGREAFRWTAESGIEGLGVLPSSFPVDSFTNAYGVSGDGRVIVGTSASGTEAFVWTRETGMERLMDVLLAGGATGLDGWTLWEARGISPDGQWVVGTGRSPAGRNTAFRARLDLPAVPRFNDVPPDFWAFSFIETLAESGITSGCGNDNYCPSSPVSRAQMAVFLERGMRGSSYNPPAAKGNVFLDVDAGSFAASFIEQFFLDGITSGCGNNNYCPDSAVTRDQMAVFLLRAEHGSGYSPPAATGVFDDVPLSHWAVHWIEQLAAEGITSGCGGNDYCPDAIVTRDQMAVFLVRTFGL